MLLIRLIDAVIYVTMLLSLIAAYPPKRNRRLCFLCVVPFAAAGVGMTLLEELLPAGSTLVYLALFVMVGSVFGVLFLSGRFPERLILLLMFVCTFELCNGIIMYFEHLIGSAGPEAFWRWKLMGVPFVMLGGYAVYRFALHSRHGLPWFCWLPIVIIAGLCMTEHLLPLITIENAMTDEWMRFRAWCSFLELCILYLAYFFCSRMFRYYENSLQMAVHQKIFDSQSQLVQESMRLNRELRKQRHEYNHTLTTALTLLRQKEYGQLESLLQDQADSGSEHGGGIRSGNAVADAVLNQKAFEAKTLHIPFKTDVCLSPDLPLSNSELISLLANLLDNAIEASQRVTDPFISVHIFPTRCYLCFSVRNRADCNQMNREDLQTTKSNREAHGFGLELIRDIARAHQGLAQFTPQPDGEFVADVTIFLGNAG